MTAKSTAQHEMSHIDNISKWEDFKLIKIDKKFERVLDTPLDTNELPPSQPSFPAEQLLVNDGHWFQSLLFALTACILNIALEAGAKVWNRLEISEILPVFMLNGS